MKLPSLKIQLLVFLSLFALILSVLNKSAGFLLTIALTGATTMVSEIIITYTRDKKWRFPQSAAISGLIIGYVLSGDNSWWILILASLCAIASKYLIRANNKHLFNPAAFGIMLVVFLFHATTQWQETYLWYVWLPAGLYFIAKIRKIEILLGYFAVALLLFGVQAMVQKTVFANIFGYFSYFFIFIMLIEPKTTPIKTVGKITFGAGVAVLIFIITEAGLRFDAELMSLLFLSLGVPFLNNLP